MIDEQIARAWGKLNKVAVEPCDCEFSRNDWHTLPDVNDSSISRHVPDPAAQPWEWVKAFSNHREFGLGHLIGQWQVYIGNELESFRRFADTPEAALEAAIRAWASS